MKYVYLALNWIFGVFFFLSGLVFFFQSPLGGLSCVLISLLLLPPIRRIVYSKTNRKIPTKARTLAIFALLILFGVFAGQNAQQEQQERAAIAAKRKAEAEETLRQEKIDYFNKNSAEIISDLRIKLEAGQFRQVVSIALEYLQTEDAILAEIYETAKSELRAIAKAEVEAKQAAAREARVETILNMLKTIPASEYGRNRALYSELVGYFPDNEKFKRKLDYYAAKAEEQHKQMQEKREKEAKERSARLAAFGEPPVQSAWDGSYYEVERFLKRVANDPDSIEMDGCTKVYQTSNGWLVGCDYRGRNAFGGMIRQSNWFTIVHGTVIAMDDASSYSP